MKSNNLKIRKLSTRVQYSFNKSTCMKDSGKMMREMEEESSNGKADPSMRDTGRTTSLMATVD